MSVRFFTLSTLLFNPKGFSHDFTRSPSRLLCFAPPPRTLRLCGVVFVAFMLSRIAQPAMAGVVYDTIDVTNGGGGTDQNGTNAWTAVNFLPTESTTINRVSFNFAITKEDDPAATFSLGLYNSSGSDGLQVPTTLITEFWNGRRRSTPRSGSSIPTAPTNNNSVPSFDVNLPVTAGTYYWFVLKSSSTDLNVLWEDIGGLASPSGDWYTNISANGFQRGRQAPASTGVWNTSVNYLAGNMQMGIETVPEPTTGLAAGVAGLFAAGGYWVRRRAKQDSGLENAPGQPSKQRAEPL